MARDESEVGLRQRIEDVADIAEITFLIGMLYVFFLAPYAVAVGTADKRRDLVAGYIGTAFWVFGMLSLLVLL